MEMVAEFHALPGDMWICWLVEVENAIVLSKPVPGAVDRHPALLVNADTMLLPLAELPILMPPVTPFELVLLTMTAVMYADAGRLRMITSVVPDSMPEL